MIPNAGTAGNPGLLHRGFTGTLGQNLVGFTQDILDVLGQSFPEAVFGTVFDTDRRIVCSAARSGRGNGGSHLRTGNDGAFRIARHVHIVDLVTAQVRRVRHYDQVAVVQLVAH